MWSIALSSQPPFLTNLFILIKWKIYFNNFVGVKELKYFIRRQENANNGNKYNMASKTLNTWATTVEVSTQWNVPMPCDRMEANVVSHNCRGDVMADYGISVSVTSKHLQKVTKYQANRQQIERRLINWQVRLFSFIAKCVLCQLCPYITVIQHNEGNANAMEFLLTACVASASGRRKRDGECRKMGYKYVIEETGDWGVGREWKKAQNQSTT